MNINPRFASMFEKAGHEASTVLSEKLSGSTDTSIFQVCASEKRCLITLDLDFSNPLRFPPDQSSGIIVLRPARPVLSLVQITLASLITALVGRNVEGKLWIVEPGRIREYVPDEQQ